MRTRTNKDIVVFFMMFMLIFIGRISFVSFYEQIKYIFILCVAVLVLFNYNKIVTNRNIGIVFIWLCLSFSLFYSSYLNRNNYESRDPLLSAVIFCSIILEFSLIVLYAQSEGKLEHLVTLYRYWGTVAVILADISVFLTKDTQSDTEYLFGDKFATAYLHMFVMALWLLRRNISLYKVKDLLIYSALFIDCMLSGIHTKCSTGTIGFVLVIVFWVLCIKFSNVFLTKTISIILIIFSFSYSFIYSRILQTPAAIFFIENVLHKDISMTGRTGIFQILPAVISKKPLWGYGYGISYEVLSRYIHGNIPNTQNAVAEWLLYGGICVVILVLIFIFYGLKNISNCSDNICIPLVCMIYSYIVIGSVEVTFGKTFFAIVLLVYGFTAECKGETRNA